MRGVQVRGAGGLLIGVCVQPLLRVFDIGAYDDGLFDAFRNFFWFPSGVTPPGGTIPFLVLRAALVAGGLVFGILGVAGVRVARFPIAVVSALLALGVLPWAIWAFDARTYRDPPPDWVMEHPLWWTSTRGMALIFMAMLVAGIVLALLDRPAQPAAAGLPPGYAPYAPYGAPPAPGPAGPWAQPGQPQPVPAPACPGSGTWPVAAPGRPRRRHRACRPRRARRPAGCAGWCRGPGTVHRGAGARAGGPAAARPAGRGRHPPATDALLGHALVS